MQIAHEGDLIDLSREDDALLPPCLNEEFLGFRLSVSERRCCEAILQPAAGAGNVYMIRTLSRSNDYDLDRKSLSWHTAFLTNEGILDAEELMLYNRGLKKAELLASETASTCKSGQKPEPRKILSRSYSMPRVPAKRTATGESIMAEKKRQPWLSGSVRSTSMSSSSSTGSVKNMLKSSISFLKKKVVSVNASFSASPSSVKALSKTSSTKSKLNGTRPAHPCRRSLPKMPTSFKNRLSVLSPSTPPYKEATGLSSEGRNLSSQSMTFSSTLTTETMFHTSGSRPSGLRYPSARFGFFDLEQRSSSRWDELFHTALKSTTQESAKAGSVAMELASSFQSSNTTSPATRAVKKLRGSVLSPVPYLPTPNHSDASDKENKFNIEAGVADLSKHLSSINLDTDLVNGPQGKIQHFITDISATPQLKRAALTSVTHRTPLSVYNRSLYSCTSSSY